MRYECIIEKMGVGEMQSGQGSVGWSTGEKVKNKLR